MAAGTHQHTQEDGGARLYGPVKIAGLAIGAGLLLITQTVSPPEGLSPAGWTVLGVAGLMAVWWAVEAIPVPATALVPLAALPLLGARDVPETAAPYANPLVFLFLGGFLVARGLQRWGLHKRIALSIAAASGARPDTLILGFMMATAFLSMWVSNTATAVMMVPIAASVIGVVALGPEQSAARGQFGTAMMLGIAYAASIGGVGTLIGTPPNAFLAAYMEQTYGQDVSFARWALIALPVVAVLLPAAWLLLTRVFYPVCVAPGLRTTDGSGRAVLRDALAGLGPMGMAERRVLMVFVAVALAWVTRPLLQGVPGFGGLSDPAIGIIGGLALFLLPAGRGNGERGQALLTWKDAEGLPWGVLLLFGGGLSLAEAIKETDLADWLGSGLTSLEGMPLLLFIVIIGAVIKLLTEMTSNTATTAAFLPIATAIASATGYDPMMLAVPVAMGASCAFMLPVATPPNAVVFASGYVTIPEMVRAGIVMNLISLGVVSLVAWLLVPVIFG